jgi:hypothetical protein
MQSSKNRHARKEESPLHADLSAQYGAHYTLPSTTMNLNRPVSFPLEAFSARSTASSSRISVLLFQPCVTVIKKAHRRVAAMNVVEQRED